MTGRALIVVDIQNDFCSEGKLAVPGGEGIIIPVNLLMEKFAATGDKIILTQDWHPADHLSFASQQKDKKPYDSVVMPYGVQTLWPDHCVQGSSGAQFYPYLDTKMAHLIVRKGMRREVDSYSALCEADASTTGLRGYLADNDVYEVFVCGLALDFCVGFTALDAEMYNFRTRIIVDACKAIDVGGSLDSAISKFRTNHIDMVRCIEI